jgi:hypothetical protein
MRFGAMLRLFQHSAGITLQTLPECVNEWRLYAHGCSAILCGDWKAEGARREICNRSGAVGGPWKTGTWHGENTIQAATRGRSEKPR